MIRLPRIDDVISIQELRDVSLGYPVMVELVQEQLIKLTENHHHFIRVFENNQGDIIGFIEAEQYESLYSKKGLNVLGLAVLPQFQLKGIGKQLLSALEQYAKENNYQFIRLNSGQHRIEAHRFYEAMNYDGNKIQKRFIKEL